MSESIPLGTGLTAITFLAELTEEEIATVARLLSKGKAVVTFQTQPIRFEGNAIDPDQAYPTEMQHGTR